MAYRFETALGKLTWLGGNNYAICAVMVCVVGA